MGQGGGLKLFGAYAGLPENYGSPGYGRLAVASSYYTAALPFTRGMPPGGQRQRTWALGGLPYGTPMSYGAEAQSGSQSDLSVYQQVGTVAGAAAAMQEVRTKLYKAQADLQALQSVPPNPVTNWLISRKQAEIAALNERLTIQLEGESSTRTWRSLGQTGSVIAIVGGVGLLGLLGVALSKAVKSTRSNPKKRKNRKRR